MNNQKEGNEDQMGFDQDAQRGTQGLGGQAQPTGSNQNNMQSDRNVMGSEMESATGDSNMGAQNNNQRGSEGLGGQSQEASNPQGEMNDTTMNAGGDYGASSNEGWITGDSGRTVSSEPGGETSRGEVEGGA